MLTRRDLLRLTAAPALMAAARAADGPDPGRIDTHLHIHRDAPALVSALKLSGWRGLDIVVCPAVGRRAVRPGGEAPRHPEGRPLQRRHARLGVHVRRPRLRAAGLHRAHDRANPPVVRRWGGRREDLEEYRHGDQVASPAAYLLPDDPALPPIYEAIQQADRTLVAHLAEPNGAWLPLDDDNPEVAYYSKNPRWHMFGKPGAPDKDAILAARDRVLARFPKLRVVGCHLGSDEDDLEQLARRLDAYPNFAVDTAVRVRYFARGDRDQVREFLTRYQDRILYATDFSLRDGDPAAAAKALQAMHDRDRAFFSGDKRMDYAGHPTRGLALPEGVLRKIFRENALRWIPGLWA